MVQNTLPDFEVKVLDESELMLVAGGLMCTSDTVSICHKDGTNDDDKYSGTV